MDKYSKILCLLGVAENYARQTYPYLFEDNSIHIEFEKINMKGMSNKELGSRKKKLSRKRRRNLK